MSSKVKDQIITKSFLKSIRKQVRAEEKARRSQNTFNLEEALIDIRLSYMRTVPSVWRSDGNTELDKIQKLNETQGRSTQNRDSYYKELDKKIIKVNRGLSMIEQQDDDYRHGFISSKERNFQDLLIAWNDFIYKYLVKNYVDKRGVKRNSDFFTQLSELKVLRDFLELCDDKNLKIIWAMNYGRHRDYPAFGIQIIQPTARWNFYGDNQWTKPETELLYIGLPTLPKENEETPYEVPKHLMNYYRHFPNFIGSQKPFKPHERPSIKKSFMTLDREVNVAPMDPSLELQKREFTEKERDPAGNNFNLGLASDQFLSFGSVMSRVITVLWTNEELRYRMNYFQRLFTETELLNGFVNDYGNTQNHTVTKIRLNNIFNLSYYLNHLTGEDAAELQAFDEQYDMEINAILNRYFHYQNPWIFHLRFLVTEPEVFFRKAKEEGNWVFKRDLNQTVNLTTIEVPFSPRSTPFGHHADVAMALARYNATGPAYPFSCS